MSDAFAPDEAVRVLRDHLGDGSHPQLSIQGGARGEHEVSRYPFYAHLMRPVIDTAAYYDNVLGAQNRLRVFGGTAVRAAGRIDDKSWVDAQRYRVIGSQRCMARLLSKSFGYELIPNLSGSDNAAIEQLGQETLVQVVMVHALLDINPRQPIPSHPGIYYSPQEIIEILRATNASGIPLESVRSLVHTFRHKKGI